MARPAKPDGTRRIYRLPIRVNAAEKRQFETLAAEAGSSVSDMVRIRFLGGNAVSHKPTPDREVLLRLLSELNKNGSNLNQVAKVYNSSHAAREHPESQAELLEQALTAFVSLAGLIRKKLQDGH